MGSRTIALVLVLAATGCSRAPERRSASSLQVSSPPAPGAAPVATPDPATMLARPVGGCTAPQQAETIDDGGGKPSEFGTTRLENLRVLAEGDVTVLTWERQTDHLVGDSWRAPVIAESEGAGTFRVKELPVRAYACATYGYAGPLTKDEHVVTWGVNNARAFEIWAKNPDTRGLAGQESMKERPVRERPTLRSAVTELATSRRVAFAATYDATCDQVCGTCPKRSSRALWLFPLAPVTAKATKVASLPNAAASPAPAVAMGDDTGVAAFRVSSAIKVLWLDRDGGPSGVSLEIAKGDVGAPTVAIAGDKAVVAWGRRATKADPYAIEWTVLERGAVTLPAVRTLPTSESAFAPSVLTDGRDVVFAWMQGDGGTKGTVLATRVALDQKDAPAAVAVSTSDEGNARDPELSGTVDAPVLAYATFSKARPGGVARVSRLVCTR